MTRQLINTGTLPNDGQGDSLRDAGTKLNSNFSELYTALGNGTTLTVVQNNLFNATGANKIAFLYNLMGIILSDQKKYEAAIGYYNEGIKVDPKFVGSVPISLIIVSWLLDILLIP